MRTRNTINDTIGAMLKDGNPLVIKLINEHYYPPLFVLANTIVRDKQIAKDVMQDSLVKVWKKMGIYDNSKSKPFTWVYKIVKNTSIDYYRKSTKTYIPLERIWNLGIDPLSIDTIDMADNLKKLTPKYRNVIDTLYIQGLTHMEAAKKLNIPLGTVKSRCNLGMIELREIYQ